MLVETLEEPLTAALVAAVDQQSAHAGLGLVIATAGPTPEASMLRARELLARGVDAVISWELQLSAEGSLFAAARAVPWIALGESANQGFRSMPSGHRKGIELACRYLLSLGHEHFAAVAPANSRLACAITDALAGTGANVAVLEMPLAERGDAQGLRGAASKLLDQPDRPTAFVCRNDLEAVGVLRECHARGISVPREISVVGFGDTDLARHAWPALTSVRVSVHELAAQALKHLLAPWDGAAEEAVEPSVKLVVRESSGAVFR
jgi:DNA-binding LacI/PurR family transcriptional regulator